MNKYTPKIFIHSCIPKKKKKAKQNQNKTKRDICIYFSLCFQSYALEI